MILFCTATEAEQKHILDFENIKKTVIGVGDTNLLFGIDQKIKETPEARFVVMFGSSGLMNFKLRTNVLYMPNKFWYLNTFKYYRADSWLMNQVENYVEKITQGLTEPIVITKRKKFRKMHEKFNIVDRESAYVIKRCNEANIPVIVIRYISDKCDKKLMPIGINHFHRKYHAWKMQQKMNLVLSHLNDTVRERKNEFNAEDKQKDSSGIAYQI